MKIAAPILLTFLFFCLNFCYAQPPNCIWAHGAGGGSGDYGKCVAVDLYGNVFIAGSFGSSFITFDTILLSNTNSNDDDLFLTKYDSMGNVLWAKHGSGNFDEQVTGLALDSFGNAYISGYFTSPTAVFGQDTLANNAPGVGDIFLVKYDSSGNIIWSKRYGGFGDEIANNLAYDNSNKLCITGTYFSSTLVFGSDTLINGGDYDMFIAEFDTSGNPIWARSATGVRAENGLDVFVDRNGEVVVSGVFSSTITTFDTIHINNISTPYNWDIFLAKYNSSGSILWVKCAGGAGEERGQGVAVDANGNIYLTGTFEDPSITFDLLSINNSSPGSMEVFLTQYNSSGNVMWARSIAGASNEYVNSIIEDDSANVYLTGMYYSASLLIDTIVLTNNGNSDIFITKFNNSGNIIWAKTYGSTDYDEGASLAADRNNNLFIAGNYWNASLILDSITLVNHGNGDAFIAKLSYSDSTTLVSELGNYNVFSIYPNPVSTETTLSFKLSLSNKLNIEIRDIEGRLINILTAKNFNNGIYEVIWDATNNSGAKVENGLYFITLTSDNFSETKKVVILKN